jgi:hypothetical protein
VVLGIPSLLVRTGVSGLGELVAARREERPTYLAADLSGLLRPHPQVHRDGGAWECGGWSAEVVDGALRVVGKGTPDDWWRAAVSAAWTHLDEVGDVVDVAAVHPPADDVGAAR